MKELLKPSCLLFGIAVYVIARKWLINVDTLFDAVVTFAIIFLPSYGLAFDLDELLK